MIHLRDYQLNLVSGVRAAISKGCRNLLINSPTGSGKTVIFAHIASGSRSKGKRVMILAHRQELLDQTARTLHELEVPSGMIAAGRTPDARQLVQIAGVQTLVRRLDKIAAPDLIIVDEAHHAAAGSWKQILAAYPQAIVLGVTATPRRLDGKGLDDVFSQIINGPQVRELIAAGYLTQPQYFVPPNVVDVTGLKSRMGDFAADEAAALMDKPTITGDIVEHYKRICGGQPAVAFCASVKHAEHMAQAFRAAGFRSETIDGTLEKSERRDRVAGLADGRIHVLTSCEIISEGFDIPVVSAAILARPTMSLSMHLQQVGRVLRPVYGAGPRDTDEQRLAAILNGPKPRAFILDHVGNCARHGLAEDLREWSLEGKKKGKKKAADEPTINVRQCPKCYACHPPAPECPDCHHVYVFEGREIEQQDGELVMLGGGGGRECVTCHAEYSRFAAACPHCGQVHDPVKARKIEQGRARTMEELMQLGVRRGHPNPRGWAASILMARNNQRQHA